MGRLVQPQTTTHGMRRAPTRRVRANHNKTDQLIKTYLQKICGGSTDSPPPPTSNNNMTNKAIYTKKLTDPRTARRLAHVEGATGKSVLRAFARTVEMVGRALSSK